VYKVNCKNKKTTTQMTT